MKWVDKLAAIRRDLEKAVAGLNKAEDYEGAVAAQEALQRVARLDDVIDNEKLDIEVEDFPR
jgi:hypothetical protein